MSKKIYFLHTQGLASRGLYFLYAETKNKTILIDIFYTATNKFTTNIYTTYNSDAMKVDSSNITLCIR